MPTVIPMIVRPLLVASSALVLALTGCSSTTGQGDGSPDAVADATVDTRPDAVTGPCAAQNASGTGACAVVVGYAWNGAACAAISGCACSGTDCGALSSSQAACEAAHAACTDCRGAGCSSGTSCQPCLGPSGAVFVCLPSGAVC
ncbi:MAG: hypothetical protein WCJ30_14030 [Deltaproteobacteria bacterium]